MRKQSIDLAFEAKLAELGPSVDAYLRGLELQKLAQEVMLDGEAKKKGVTAGDVDPEQLAMGIKVEMEHTPDPVAARKITLDHLAEVPDYYTRLKAMEAEAGVEKKGQDAGAADAAPVSITDAATNLGQESERLQVLEALRRAGKNVWEYGLGPGFNKATEPLLRAADLPNPFPM